VDKNIAMQFICLIARVHSRQD